MTTHLITGLPPGSRYDVYLSDEGGSVTVTITAGAQVQADQGGVLVVQPGAE